MREERLTSLVRTRFLPKSRIILAVTAGPARRMGAFLLTSIGALLMANPAQASLIGDEITATAYEFGNPICGPVTEIVQEGPEVMGNWCQAIGYDIEASTIHVWTLTPPPHGAAWLPGLSFEFVDLDCLPDGGEIVAVNVTSATGEGWSNIDSSDLSFTAHSVTINASDIAGVTVANDQSVSIEITFVPVCSEDVTGDGVVNVLDLIQLIMSFGPCEGCPADFNDDGFVNVLDLIALIMNFGPCPGTPCVWDVNGDGVVDQSDVQQVLANLGPCEGCPEDVNGDGVVNGQDVAAVATHFGPCP